MKHEYMCRSREEIRCVYVTEENVEEFINTYGLKKNGKPLEYTIEFKNEYAIVRYEKSGWNIRMNTFMVEEPQGWVGYTDREFAEYYEITV